MSKHQLIAFSAAALYSMLVVSISWPQVVVLLGICLLIPNKPVEVNEKNYDKEIADLKASIGLRELTRR